MSLLQNDNKQTTYRFHGAKSRSYTFLQLTPEDSSGTRITVSIGCAEDYSGVGLNGQILSDISWKALNVPEIDQQRQINQENLGQYTDFENFICQKIDSICHKLKHKAYMP